MPFLITGVLTPKGLSPQGTDQDDIVIMPYTSAMKRVLGGTTLRGINVQVATPNDLAPAQQQITELLRQRHNIRPGRDDDFTVRNQQEIAETATATSKVMTLLLGAIASVSLVVGGIGIMNIMLVSVTERTREIGVRLAVGAHGRDILTQFLIEAVTLSSIGGVIGIILGLGTSQLLSSVAHWPTLISISSIVVAFLSAQPSEFLRVLSRAGSVPSRSDRGLTLRVISKRRRGRPVSNRNSPSPAVLRGG